MAEVKLKEVDKVYDGGVHAVQDLSLEVPDGSSSSWSGLPAVARRPPFE